jgi:hypothetical protein
MKDKTFLIVLAAMVALLTVATVAHLRYMFYAYEHCSIIYFIGKELW